MTPTHVRRLGGLALAALALCAGPAAAQGSATPAQRQAAQACMPDIRAYCPTVPRGDGRIAACLRQNSERLSPDCRRASSSLPR